MSQVANYQNDSWSGVPNPRHIKIKLPNYVVRLKTTCIEVLNQIIGTVYGVEATCKDFKNRRFITHQMALGFYQRRKKSLVTSSFREEKWWPGPV